MMRGAIRGPLLAGGLVALATFVGPPLAAAQGAIGLGARFAFNKPVVPTESGTPRFAGGLFRGRLASRATVEVSLDHRGQTLAGERVRSWPLQASLLFYPIRSTVSVYLLGGYGWYFQRVDALAGGETVASVSSRRSGSHAGVGGEIQLGRYLAWHVDYRYTFIGFSDEAPDRAGGALPLPGFIALQEKMKLRHEAAMWTTGVTFYF